LGKKKRIKRKKERSKKGTVKSRGEVVSLNSSHFVAQKEKKKGGTPDCVLKGSAESVVGKEKKGKKRRKRKRVSHHNQRFPLFLPVSEEIASAEKKKKRGGGKRREPLALQTIPFASFNLLFKKKRGTIEKGGGKRKRKRKRGKKGKEVLFCE